MTLDWDHVYLLGWYDHSGRSYLTTWDGDLPMLHVVVFGSGPFTMPLWDAPVPPGARFEVVEGYEVGMERARREGGLYAIGWYIEKGVERRRS